MAGFRSDREQSKWDKLQSTNAASIDKVLKGVASPADIKAIANVLSQQSDLAAKVFEDGISSAEATADAIIDKLNSDRIGSGKKPLTQKAQDRLFKSTYQKVLQAQSDDIIASVKDYLDEKFSDQDDVQDERIESAFKRITSEAKARQQNPPEPRHENGIVNQISSLTRTLTTNAPITSADAKPNSIVAGLRTMVDDYKKKKAMRANPETTMESVMSHYGVKSAADVEAAVRANPAGNSSVDTQVTKALSANDALRKKAQDEWDRIDSKRNTEEGDEDKKSETWLRKVKSMFGGDTKKKKGGDEGSTGWIGMLGKALLLTLMNPQLISTIADGISKYLNFETISKFISDSLETVKNAGSEVLNWIIDKVKGFFAGDKKAAIPKTAADHAVIAASVNKESQIPKDTTVAAAKNAIPEIQHKIEATKVALAKAQKWSASEPTSDDAKVSVSRNQQRLAILQGQLANYQSVAAGKPATAGQQPAAVSTLAPAPAQAPAGSASVPKTSATSPAATGAAPASVTANAGPTKTTVTAADMPRYKEGITLEDDNKTASQTGGGGSVGGGQSTSTVSMNSFGFNSGNDSMNLINVGALG